MVILEDFKNMTVNGNPATSIKSLENRESPLKKIH
jgi:hypothetical protein